MDSQTLRNLLLVHKEGEVFVDHTTGPWIASLAEDNLVCVSTSDGPIKCLVATLSDLGKIVVESAEQAAQIAMDEDKPTSVAMKPGGDDGEGGRWRANSLRKALRRPKND
jgi:hypothetical protein